MITSETSPETFLFYPSPPPPTSPLSISPSLEQPRDPAIHDIYVDGMKLIDTRQESSSSQTSRHSPSTRGKTRLHELPESPSKSSGYGPKKAKPSVSSVEKSGSVVDISYPEPFCKKTWSRAQWQKSWRNGRMRSLLTSSPPWRQFAPSLRSILQDLKERTISDHAVIDQLTDRVLELSLSLTSHVKS